MARQYTIKINNLDYRIGTYDTESYEEVYQWMYSRAMILKARGLGSVSYLSGEQGISWTYSIAGFTFAHFYCARFQTSANSNGRCEAEYVSQSEASTYLGRQLTNDEISAILEGMLALDTMRSILKFNSPADNLWDYTDFDNTGISTLTFNTTLPNVLQVTKTGAQFKRSASYNNRLPCRQGYTGLFNQKYSGIYFADHGTDALTLQRSRGTSMLNSQYIATNLTFSQELGGGLLGLKYVIYCGWGSNYGGVFESSNVYTGVTASDYFADTDNTYPGGGDDKNPYPDEDSVTPGGESGKGDFDNTNDPIDFPTLPTWDVQSTGFISLWQPTITQLTDLYTFLWDSDISTTLKKLFNEPMNAIFSLGIIPVDPITQGTRRLTIGHVDTEIDMESIQKQFVTFDFGSIDINEYYGAAWDYSPYTHASIYLPYIGVQPVDIDDIMNCTLTLRYNIDVLTGTTIALLKCVRKGRDNLNAVMYEWQGNCVTQCPITAGNWSQIMASVIQLGAMTGLALSQPVVGAIGSAVGSSAAAEYAQGKNLVNPTMATYGALNVLGSKVHVQRGGRLDMSSGAMSMQKAFVILNRPVSGIPRGWNNYAGYPSLKIKTLGSQEGFVSVGAIKLDGLRATAEEINELDTILKTGVII